MKILFVSAAYPPLYTGIGAYTYNMARALSTCGHQVIIVTTKSYGLPEHEITDAGIVLRCYSWQELRTKKLARRLLEIVCEYQVDLIESADFLGEAGQLLRLKHDIPVCIKAHNSGPVAIGRESEILYFWQRWMQWGAILREWKQYREEKYSIEHGDFLVTPSSKLMSELEKQGLNLPRCRFVQPNPISLSLDCQSKNVESPVPTLLFVGRLAVGKGIAFLPKIMRELVPIYPNIRLVIAGSDSYARGLGSLKKWLENRLGTLINNVEFTGQLGREDLINRYDRAWVVLVPSLWDTFPTVILEAMSRAKPVVASNNGGIPEMLQNTKCSAVDPKLKKFVNEIRLLLEDSLLRRKTGLSMLEKARTCYSPEVIAKTYIEKLQTYLNISS